MDAGSMLAPLYEPAMHACGWARVRDIVLAGTRGTTLDVGCGPAGLSSDAGTGYVGVDVRMAMLVRARSVVACADAASLPFRDGSFDTVVSSAFLGLLSPSERHPVLCEMARVCRGSMRILEPLAPLRPTRRLLALARHPLDVTELVRAGWQVRSVGPRVYAGAYTLVCATPLETQSR